MWQSPFPAESLCPGEYCTQYFDSPCQLEAAPAVSLHSQLHPVFEQVVNHKVLQSQPGCLLKPFSIEGEIIEDFRGLYYSRGLICVFKLCLH